MAWVEKKRQRWVGYYRDANGKKHRAGSNTHKRAALGMAQDEESKIRSGVWHDPRAGADVTFRDYFLHQWLPYRNREVLTRRNYVSHFRCELESVFGDLPLNKITFSMIQRWVVDMQTGTGRERPLAASTVRSRFGTLSVILGAREGVSAVRDGFIPVNPCNGVTLPAKVKKRKVAKYEVDEIEDLLAVIDPWWRSLVLFQTETGVRWGELMGLTVADFDRDFETVTVQRTIIRVSREAAKTLGVPAGYQWKNYPKGKNPRHIALTDDCSTAVRRLIRERELFGKDRLFSRPDPADPTKPLRDDEWPEGRPIHEGRFREEVWVPAHDAIGMEVRKMHAMRASHICWLLAEGMDVVSVQKRVGHDDLATTQLYADSMKDADRRAADAINNLKRRRRA